MELLVLYPAMLACRHLCTGVDADVYADADGGGRSACERAGVLVRVQERLLGHCFKVTFLLIISNNLGSLFIDDTIPIKFYRASSV